jgi:hypothetical protein
MKPIRLDEYAPLVGAEEVAEIRALAACLGSVSLQHINSTSQGGGVAEILSWLVPLMQDVGIDARWTVIEGPTEFFEVTKAFHNALHGMSVEINPEMFALFRSVIERRSPGFFFGNSSGIRSPDLSLQSSSAARRYLSGRGVVPLISAASAFATPNWASDLSAG